VVSIGEVSRTRGFARVAFLIQKGWMMLNFFGTQFLLRFIHNPAKFPLLILHAKSKAPV
jgi:hypothetical protein